ncbi:MAG: nucleotidyltransferase domain-containing protein [Bacteroidales bacterium]|nr:nucleotidyltransferase domain-containing protein [Bacteroidales bacterium]
MMKEHEKDHWKWRYDMAQTMAAKLDMERLGVKALYLIGSVKTGEAGPCSDIDLLAHCTDDSEKHEMLKAYCEGWGHCLAEFNECKTTFRTSGSLVDLHIITDKDIQKKTSFAVMLDSVDNSARLLKKCPGDA